MRRRRTLHLALATVLLPLFSSCNYVHFGRIDRSKFAPELAAENSDLRLEKKLLQQELALARKEGETLRAALDRPAAESPALVAKLNETTRELATLRANYARLQSEREHLAASPAAPAADAPQLAELQSRLNTTEEKLAETLRTYTELQNENRQLRTELDQVHAENSTLTAKLAQVTAQNNEARSALAELNTEFLAQKEARAQAEQEADSLRTQLHAVASQAAPASDSLAAARESSAGGAREIEATLRAPGASSSSASATLSTNPEKLRRPPPSATIPVKPARHYVVRDGDTLEKIAEQFYGRRDRWSVLYAANNSLLSNGRPLKPGMELEIPEE